MENKEIGTETEQVSKYPWPRPYQKKPEPKRYSFEPVWDGVNYENKPKVRGMFMSFLIGFITFMISSNLLAMVFFGVYLLTLLIPGNTRIHPDPLIDTYIVCFLMALFFDAFGHFTPFFAYFGARVEKSLSKVILFALFGRRIWGNSGSGVFFIRS